MSEKKELFADGLGQVHFSGRMVRFDFITLQPAAEGEAPVPQSSVRIIMPPQGFLNTFSSMQQLIDKLLAAGILEKTVPAAAAAPAPEKPAELAEPVKPAKPAKKARKKK